MYNDDNKKYKGMVMHLFIALRRKKDNPDGVKICLRHVIKDDSNEINDLMKLKNILWSGVWRIHKTINTRDIKKAKILLMHRLLDSDSFDNKIDMLWKTCLMKSKHECKMMLDIDDPPTLQFKRMCDLKNDGSIPVLEEIKTPNGYHWVCDKFDTRIIKEYCGFVTIHRDGYKFIEKIIIN